MAGIPKARIVEIIRNRDGADAADSANEELPNSIDLDSDSDAGLLRRYDIDPNDLREEFEGGSPHTG